MEKGMAFMGRGSDTGFCKYLYVRLCTGIRSLPTDGNVGQLDI